MCPTMLSFSNQKWGGCLAPGIVRMNIGPAAARMSQQPHLAINGRLSIRKAVEKHL